MRERRVVVVALLAAATTGIAVRAAAEDRGVAATPAGSYARYAGAPIERFSAFRLDGFTPVSRTGVVVWNGPNEAYLITVRSPCTNLQRARAISVTTSGRSVTTFERVTTGSDDCRIASIQPIDVGRMKADREAGRKATDGLD